MRNLLITGGSGMLGKNLLEHSKASFYNILAPTSHDLNLLNYDGIVNYLKFNSVDIIIHCAGQVGGIQANIGDPVGFLYNNLMMGLNLINAARITNVPKVINLGSSCMYPKDYINPLKEHYILAAPLEPTNEGYALSKITVAKMCEYVRRQFGLNYKTLIPCNLYGKWDKFGDKNSHLIPAVIKKIHQAKINNEDYVSIWGDGSARREFMFASDCADGIFFALDNFDNFDDYTNLGIGYDYTIAEYYDIVKNIIGYSGAFKYELDKPVGMKQKLIDISYISSMGWKAKHSLEEGIVKTYQFFMKEEQKYERS